MAEGELGEKTEAPTPRKRSEARGKGQVPKSQDLSGAIGLIAAVAVLVVMGGEIFGSLGIVMMRTLDGSVTHGALATPDTSVQALEWTMRVASFTILPALIVLALVAYITQFVQVGPLLTLKPITPKLDKINPVSGVKRLVSKRNLVKTIVSVAKLIVVVGVSWLVIAMRMPDVTALPRLGAAQGMLMVMQMVFWLAVWLLAILLILGVIDFIYQKWQHTQDLKMTKQEVKDERKSHEGSPEVKKRRMEMAHRIAMQRVQSATPGADVIITNPTHYSVALKYDESSMRAPRVVAKGVDLVALRIRQIARTHDVPVIERPPLARALYGHVEVGEEIPSRFYEAVAEVLAFVYRLENEAAA